jgi:outer membrane biosynthesis protein TonB
MPYKSDHIKVLKVFGAMLPKRPSMKTSEIVAKAFKNAEDGDRRVRNAYRMIRKSTHIEIGDRGEYKMTQTGAAWFTKAEKEGFKVPEKKVEKAKSIPRPIKAPTKKAKPATKAKAAMKAKPATKKVAAKPATKLAVKKSIKPTKKVAAKAGKMPFKKKSETTPEGKNGTGTTTTEMPPAASTLTF